MKKHTPRELNTAARIFRTIWRRPRISRVGIADRLGLDKSTVTNQVNQLIDLGLIVEMEEGLASSRGGRKPIHLGIRKSFGRTLGLELQADRYVAVAVDLAGEILSEARGSFQSTPETFQANLAQLLHRISQELVPGPEPLLGVGIGMGGLIDTRRGVIRYSVPLDIKDNLDVSHLLATALDAPCFIENDANCCAWGELAFNRSEEFRDFMFALVECRQGPTSVGTFGGLGVGIGIVMGGKVHPGVHGTAGEFRSAFCQGAGELQLSLSKEELSAYGRDLDIQQRVSDELARNFSVLVNVMDFQRVFVGGDIEGLPIDFPALLRTRLEESRMYPFPKEVEIRYSSLGDRAVAYGATGMTLDRLVSESLLPGLGPAR